MLAGCHLRDFFEVRLITCIFLGERNSPPDSHQIVNKNIASFRIIQLCTQAFTTIPYTSNIVIERRQLQQQLLLLLIQNWSTPFLLGGISWPAQQCSSQRTTLGFSDWDDLVAIPPDSGSVKFLLVWTHVYWGGRKAWKSKNFKKKSWKLSGDEHHWRSIELGDRELLYHDPWSILVVTIGTLRQGSCPSGSTCLIASQLFQQSILGGQTARCNAATGLRHARVTCLLWRLVNADSCWFSCNLTIWWLWLSLFRLVSCQQKFG